MTNVTTKLYRNSAVEETEWTNLEEAYGWARTQQADKIEIYNADGNLIDEVLPSAADENPNAVPPAPTE